MVKTNLTNTTLLENVIHRRQFEKLSFVDEMNK